MLDVKLNLPDGVPFRVLCLGAHCDDIEIGCGGTILNLIRSNLAIEIYWLVLSSTQARKREALRSADFFLGNKVRRNVVIHEFRDGFLPYHGGEIKESFERLKGELTPDLILTHYRNDLHQDHRLISELTWNTFRDHLILEYEIPKYDGDFNAPNFFVALSEEVRRQKISNLMTAFPSQKEKAWFCPELFSSVLRLRGMESNAASGYAEGFYCRKATLRLSGEIP